MEMLCRGTGLFWILFLTVVVIGTEAININDRRHHRASKTRFNAQDDRCPKDQFMALTEGVPGDVSSCQDCSTCPPGTGVVRECRRRKDTVCRKCRKGATFSNLYSRWSSCTECNSCENARVKRRCKPNRNSVCGRCNTGYFFNTLEKVCERCGYCFPHHPDVDAYRLKECSRGGFPEDFQCVPMHNPPYEVPPYPNVTDVKGNKGRRRKVKATNPILDIDI